MKKKINIISNFLAIVVVILLITSCNEDEFPTVSIDNLSTESVFQGEEVSMTGQGFENVQFLFLGYDQLDYTLEENTITFTVPDDFQVGMTEITLAMVDNQRETHPFEVLLKPSPVIENFTAFVPVGGDLVIDGVSLDNNTTISIDGIDATANITSNDGNQMVVTVPDGVNTGGPTDFEITTDYGTATSSVAFYAKENLLANSQLEEGEGDDFPDWEKLNGGDGVTAVTGYGGTRSMHVVPAGGNPWDTQVASTGVPLTLDEEYTVILWAKGDAAGAQMRVSVSQYDGAGADYFYGETVELSTNWEQYTWTFTVGKDLPTHRVVLDMGMGSVPFMIDHIGLVQGTIGSAGPPELLTNGSFEDGMTGWESLNGMHEVSTDEFYCGSASLKATGAGGNPWDTQMASDPMDLVEGTEYEISFWAKAAGPDGVFRISMSQYDGNGSDFFYSADQDIPEEWTYFSFVVEAEPVPSGEYRLLFDMGATTQTFFVDGVSVKEYVPSISLYANGGFEDGMTGWESLNGTHEISTDEFHTGSASLTAIGAGGNPWDTQLATDPVDLTVGQDYKISFWAKAAGPDGVFRISMSQYDGNGADFFYSPDLDIPEEWTYFSFVVTAESTASGDHRLLFDMGATTQTFFLDDVAVEEYDGCEE